MKMNVIKYDVEIIKPNRYWFQFWKNKENGSVKEILTERFENELVYQGNFKDLLENEWNELEYENIKNLNHPNYLLGYFTVKNSKIFLFEIKNAGISGKNNMSIQIYAFGSIPIEDLLNESFKRLKNYLLGLSCSLINKSQIYIFPFNSSSDDIESTELKIKAKIESFIKTSITDFFKWGIIIILSLIALVWSQSITDTSSDSKSVLLSIFGSGLFYVLLDIIISIFIPFVFNFNKKSVTISDLSSVLESTNIVDRVRETEELNSPE